MDGKPIYISDKPFDRDGIISAVDAIRLLNNLKTTVSEFTTFLRAGETDETLIGRTEFDPPIQVQPGKEYGVSVTIQERADFPDPEDLPDRPKVETIEPEMTRCIDCLHCCQNTLDKMVGACNINPESTVLVLTNVAMPRPICFKPRPELIKYPELAEEE